MFTCSGCSNVAFASIAEVGFVGIVHGVAFVGAGHGNGSNFEPFDAFHGSHTNACLFGAWILLPPLELEGCDACVG